MNTSKIVLLRTLKECHDKGESLASVCFKARKILTIDRVLPFIFQEPIIHMFPNWVDEYKNLKTK